MGRMGYIVRCISRMDYGALFKTWRSVCKKSDKNPVWLFTDIVKCGLTYGAGYVDYEQLGFYDLTDVQRATYVTRGVNNQIVRMLNDPAYYHLVDNKHEFYGNFSEYLHRDWLYFEDCTREKFDAFAAQHPTFMAKPDDAKCGAGIEKLSVSDFPSTDALWNHLKEAGTSVVEEVVVQHPAMAALNPSSVNTLRVYSLLVDGEPHVIYACVRMGAGDKPVDNLNAGGMFAEVDLETGKICGPACDKNFHVYENHPLTGTYLPGYQIPLWEDVKGIVLDASQKIPQMGYLGWDVAIAPDTTLLIETNNLPGHDLFPQTPTQAPDHVGFKPVFQKYLKSL